MRYLVLVTDYDGTIATGGKADESTLSALERLRMSGRRAILLTGRRLDDLLSGLSDALVCSIMLWRKTGR